MDEAQQVPNQNPITPVAPIPTYPTPQPTSTSKTSWILITLIVALLGVASYFGYQYYQLKKQIAVQQPTPTPSVVASSPISKSAPTPTTNPTENWKTYTNDLSAYTFRYPSNWLLLDLTAGKQIEVYYQPDKTQPVGELLIEQMDQAPGDILQYKDQKMIGNLSAKCKSDLTVKTWCYIETKSNGKLSVLIVQDKNKQYNDTLDQILSTFQFTK